jgi:alkylation response protein AidB-like acyl-CoA dehydrogenase
VDNIYITPEHELLREQVARFIEREVEPHAAAWEEPAACRAMCCAAWARRACSG